MVIGCVEWNQNVKKKNWIDKVVPYIVDVNIEAYFKWDRYYLIENKQHAKKIPNKFACSIWWNNEFIIQFGVIWN
jgi:hypothetical protein